MTRSDFETLLNGLPDTEDALLSAVQRLIGDGDGDRARDLLREAVEQSASTVLTLALAQQLIDAGRARRGMEKLNALRASADHEGSIRLLRALAQTSLDNPELARAELRRARSVNSHSALVDQWEAHLVEDAPRPPLPEFQLGQLDERTDPLLDGEDESTDPLVDRPPSQRPGRASMPTAPMDNPPREVNPDTAPTDPDVEPPASPAVDSAPTDPDVEPPEEPNDRDESDLVPAPTHLIDLDENEERPDHTDRASALDATFEDEATHMITRDDGDIPGSSTDEFHDEATHMITRDDGDIPGSSTDEFHDEATHMITRDDGNIPGSSTDEFHDEATHMIARDDGGDIPVSSTDEFHDEATHMIARDGDPSGVFSSAGDDFQDEATRVQSKPSPRAGSVDKAEADDDLRPLLPFDGSGASRGGKIERSSRQVPRVEIADHTSSSVPSVDVPQPPPHEAPTAPPDATADPSADKPTQASRPTPMPTEPDVSPSGSAQFVRQFTTFVRDQASSQLMQATQSPARALLIATITATAVLSTGASLIYASLAHTHYDRQLERIERSIGADLYSSHLAALRDLSELSDHQVLPWQPVDDVAATIVDGLPLIGTADKRERIAHLTTFVEARLDYRFEIPGRHLSQSPQRGESELLDAAVTYQLLSVGDVPHAVSLAEIRPSLQSAPLFSLMAYADAVVAGGGAEDIQEVVSQFEAHSPAQRFIKAQLYERLGEEDRAIELLEPIADSDATQHIGAQLMIARLDGDESRVQQTIDTIADPNHRHASRIEHAQALILAATQAAEAGDTQGQQDYLERAALRVPLRADVVSARIDHFLRTGALSDARSQLARTPHSDTRHPYFDLTQARLDLIAGDHEAVHQRLAPHAERRPLAASKLAVASVLSGDRERALRFADRATDTNGDIGHITSTWLTILEHPDDQTPPFQDGHPTEHLPILSKVLAADTLRRQATALDDTDTRRQRFNEAREALGNAPLEWPETRRLACVIALDHGDRQRQTTACESVVERDVQSRQSMPVALRWLLNEGDLDAARQWLNTHVGEMGSDPHISLLGARIDLIDEEFDDARRALDDLSPRADADPEFLITEGIYSIHRGQWSRASRYFGRAEQATAIGEAQLRLGEVDSAPLFDALERTDDESQATALRDQIRRFLAP